MKTFTHLLLIASVVIISSCRKDPPLIGLEPNGNTLIMQLNVDYEIDGAAELMLDVNFIEDKLDLVLNTAPSKFILQFANSLDTVLYLRNEKLVAPALSAERIANRDGRLHTRISADDFTPLYNSVFDSSKLIEKVGDSRLLHGYFNTETGEKISLIRTTLSVTNEEFDISIPTVKYFLFVGL